MPVAPKHRPLARGDACQSCKSRKIRCPAEKPACSNCTKKNRECIYNSTSTAEESPLPQPDVYPNYPTTSTSSFDHSPAVNSSSSSARNPSIVSLHQSSSSFDSLNATSASIPPFSNPPSYHESPWMQDFGIVGALPSMMGPLQNLPSPWENFDLTALLGQGTGTITNTADRGLSSPVVQAELTEMERDHLLLLFFTGQRIFGVDMHISTFYTRLQSSDPVVRPHPCLLNAIYLMTCRGSPLESLRKQEQHFYRKAKEHMDIAVASPNTLFDAIRTGTMLAAWLFGAERHMEGWAMMGQTVRLAIAAGLDRIQSSTDIDPTYNDKGRKKRGISAYLRPPVSLLELADRIYAFWTLFLADRCTSIAFELPAGFDRYRIITPLPRPWAEYETNDPHLLTCDLRLSYVYEDQSSPSNTCGGIHMVEIGYILGALDLLHQVSLRPPLPERERLHKAIATLNMKIPRELKDPVKSEEGKSIVNPDTATIQIIMLCTEMFLYSIDSVNRPDIKALEAGRRILGILHLLKDANIGDVNLFAIIIWCRVARLLVWESKRLEACGDAFAAATFANDVQFITSFLQQLAHINLAAEALKSIQLWWSDDLSTFGGEYACSSQLQHSAGRPLPE